MGPSAKQRIFATQVILELSRGEEGKHARLGSASRATVGPDLRAGRRQSSHRLAPQEREVASQPTAGRHPPLTKVPKRTWRGGACASRSFANDSMLRGSLGTGGLQFLIKASTRLVKCGG